MWYLVILIQYVFKIFDQTWFTCCRWSTLNCSADTHASALYTSYQTYLSKFPRWDLIFHFHSKCPAENGEETLQTCESLWAKRKSSPLPSEDLLHRILLWYSKIPKKATHLVLHLVKEIPALHPLARPAAWDWERNSGWVAFLCQLPSGDTPAGDWLQLGSRRAVRAPRTFRFPFPGGNWLAWCPWKLSPSVSLLTANTESAHLLPQQRKHTRQVNGAVRHGQESWK